MKELYDIVQSHYQVGNTTYVRVTALGAVRARVDATKPRSREDGAPPSGTS
jgi:hypothetical protein